MLVAWWRTWTKWRSRRMDWQSSWWSGGKETPRDASARETRRKHKRSQLPYNTLCVWLEEETISTWRWYFSHKRWTRRSRLVAREFALGEGKRNYIFLTSDFRTCTEASTHNILAKDQWRRWGKRGRRRFSQVLGCLDVKGAFLQVPQEKRLKVILRG